MLGNNFGLFGNFKTHILEGTGWAARRFVEDDGPRYTAVIEKV